MSRRQWIRLEKHPDLALIGELPKWRGFYQGDRVVMCETRVVADRIIGMMRERGTEAERCDRPKPQRWGAVSAWIVGTCFYKPRRWTPW